MNQFQRFYLWAMHAKFFMGLYFTVLVFLGGLLTAAFGGDALLLVTLLQMLLASVVIAFVQVWLLPAGVDFSRGIFSLRAVIWLVFSFFCVALTAQLGGWFATLPAFCPWAMGCFMLFACAAMLFGLKFEQDADTLRLNEQLKKFQQ